MNVLDIIFLIPIAWFGFKGFKNGLISELASVAALLLGIWATFKFSDTVATRLGDEKVYKAVAFIVVFIAVLVAVYFAGKIMEKVVKLFIPSIINNFFGLLFGVVKVLLVLSVLVYFINSVDFKHVILKPETKEKSFLYHYVESAMPFTKTLFVKE